MLKLQLSLKSRTASSAPAAIEDNNTTSVIAAAREDSAPRYLVKFAHIPSEAFWCTATNWRELVTKTQQVWGLEAPYFTFTTINALDKQVTFRMTCAADFESMWANPDAPAMRAAAHKKLGDEAIEARQSPYSLARSTGATNGTNGVFFGPKLVAHDCRIFKHVAHSSEMYQYSIRPLVSTGLLSYWPTRYVLRHTVTNEVVPVCERESPSWGHAVQKAQREWGVLRPLFRYVDDIDGERTVISIVTAEDFQLWMRRRRPLWPELLVFEHAAPNLLQEHRNTLQVQHRASTASSSTSAMLGVAGGATDEDLGRMQSLGISPLAPDVGGDVSYFPSSTNPDFNRRGNASSAHAQAKELLGSFRPESLRDANESDKLLEERRHHAAREKHMAELQKALMSSAGSSSAAGSSPRRAIL